MIISAICAMSEDRVIGNQNQLPWHLPADLKHFKQLTVGKIILMGRKTYESIGRPLPERTNLILTHDVNYQAPGCIIVNSFEQVLKEYSTQKELVVIGGALVYQLLLPHIQRIYLTTVHASFPGDSYFPKLDPENWSEHSFEPHPADEKNPWDYHFSILDRKK